MKRKTLLVVLAGLLIAAVAVACLSDCIGVCEDRCYDTENLCIDECQGPHQSACFAWCSAKLVACLDVCDAIWDL